MGRLRRRSRLAVVALALLLPSARMLRNSFLVYEVVLTDGRC